MAHALIFDSGVGGLSVVSEIRARMPDLQMSYIADDAFRPYGTKSEAALRERLPGLLATLEHMLKPDLIVIACNTASVTALQSIRDAVHAEVVGVVPAIKPAAHLSRSKSIAVLGTPGTVRREYVDSLIRDFASDCRVTLKGSSRLVELAEQQLAGGTILAKDVCAEVASLFKPGSDIDCVVLACTHFPLLKGALSSCAGAKVKWIDSGSAIAKRVETLLQNHKNASVGRQDIAFLIGPQTTDKRRETFRRYGFHTVVGLQPRS